ncbi:MAG: U32 family peptidase [Lentisphaeria bacterium]|jgi:collagenase-like PrtC family protease|nr:U32 family peptidase [Lentisphaeria bacterium]
MQLTLGLDHADRAPEIAAFARQGVGEFFAGFVPCEWFGRFGWEVGLNRRTFGGTCQYTDLDELREAAAAVHAAGRRLLITLNAHDYGHARLGLVREVVRALETIGHDGYIVADPALMGHLREWGVQSLFHLSTGAGAFNGEAIRFFHERYGLRRVVIPRKMTLREMRQLMASVADLGLEFEVMIIGYRCHFNDEFCFSWHSGAGANFCTNFMRMPKQLRARFPRNWKDILQEAIDHAEEQFAAGSALDEFCHRMTAATPAECPPAPVREAGEHSQLPMALFNNCGLCAIPALRDMGVHTLKIPVRGAPWQKARYLEAVRAVLDHHAPTAEFCRGLVRSEGFCAMPEACYYHLGETKG